MAISYYKIIDGKRYDRQMLKVVEEAVARNEDRQVLLDSAKKLYKVIIDGNRITTIERETLEYIKEKFVFEKDAEKWLERQVEAWDNKKNKRKLFSFDNLRILRSGPIVQPAKAAKKPKKKSRVKPPKRKVTIDLKSIGRRPKPAAKIKSEEKLPVQDIPPVVAEELKETQQQEETPTTLHKEQVVEETQTITEPISGEKPSNQESLAEKVDLSEDAELKVEKPSDQEPLPDEADLPKDAELEDETDVTTVAESPEEDSQPAPAATRIKPLEQAKPAPLPGSSISRQPLVRDGGFNSWKLYAIICLLLVPVSFFVGRGFEPIRYGFTDDSRLGELEEKLQTRDQEIVLLKTEKQALKADLENTTAVAQASSTPQEIKKAETKRKISTALTDQLSEEFSSNLIRFDKERLWLTFLPSESYFNGGSSGLNPSLKKALRKFFPNFVETLITFEEDISEIRFQGHSSSRWRNAKNQTEAYLKNLSLSNARAEAALRYCLGLKEVAKHRAWLEDRMVSSGFSNQKPVLTQDKTEDPIKSRRITISVGVAGPKN